MMLNTAHLFVSWDRHGQGTDGNILVGQHCCTHTTCVFYKFRWMCMMHVSCVHIHMHHLMVAGCPGSL